MGGAQRVLQRVLQAIKRLRQRADFIAAARGQPGGEVARLADAAQRASGFAQGSADQAMGGQRHRRHQAHQKHAHPAQQPQQNMAILGIGFVGQFVADQQPLPVRVRRIAQQMLAVGQ